jgi:ribosomal protein S12 methylthiotransferase accessory factor
MELEIRLHHDDRVDARFDGIDLITHQDGSAPAPFDLFLASIGTCAGIYVSRFCRQRGIDARDVRIRQSITRDDRSNRVTRIDLEVELPESFPPRYRSAVVRAAELCSVKKHLADPPEIHTRAIEPSTSG